VIKHNNTKSVGLIWTSDQPSAETSTCTTRKIFTRKRHPCPPAGFEQAVIASELPQTQTLDCAVTGIGVFKFAAPKFTL